MLIMKAGSDNLRESLIQSIINSIQAKGIEVIICEPALNESMSLRSWLIRVLDSFKKKSEITINNSMSDKLADISDKVYERDLFRSD